MNGLDTFLRMAQEKSQSYSTAKNVLLLKFDDLVISILSLVSFVLLLVARYITVALYYFFWVLLSILSPLMILAYIFPETAGVTKNLYRGLIEVAAWKILWAVMSAMLTSLAFGNIYQTEGSYLTLMVLNFVIAIALLCTPLMMKSLVGDGIQGMAQTIGTAAAMSFVSMPLKIRQAKEIAMNPRGYLNSKIKTYNEPNNRR